MIHAMRTKMGPVVIGGVIAVIAAVFIFYGIFTPGSGGQGPGVAGEVNGETISYTEFSHALNQQLEMYRGMLGGKISDDMLQSLHINETVFQRLTQQKLVSQLARKEGFYPSNEQIRAEIMSIPQFQKDGHFDKVQYKDTLVANQYTPTQFEERTGDQIMDQNFINFLRQMAFVGPDEVDQELKIAKDRKKFKFVYVDNESVRKMLPKDLKPGDQGKALDQKVGSLAGQILPDLSKGQDAKINALLKDQKITVKTSDWLNSQSTVIPGVGSLKMIESELFTMKKGDPAKKFNLMGGTFFAQVQDQENFDPSKLTAKERQDTFKKLQSQRENEFISEFIAGASKKASISRNDKIVLGNQTKAAN
jgi:parvulin-like peptidyl-prolyl isomerase